MLPVIALVGRPNVGKSTLFNCLTRSRDALVADLPGLTRDRIYGLGKIGDRPYIVVDTGGLVQGQGELEDLLQAQAMQAVHEAQAVLFLVDAQVGLTPADEWIASKLRQTGKTIYIVVNKTDSLNAEMAKSDFHALGLGAPLAIAAAHNRGIAPMMEAVLSALPPAAEAVPAEQEGIRVAIVGRPNVGKSTLVNRILGEERVLVFDMPGTTRDSISIPFERDGDAYTLIDTAGVRRRARIEELVEKFSVIKTLQSIESAHVVVLLLDAHEGVTDQDAHLLGFVLDSGRALVIAINKWDGLTPDQRERVKSDLDRKLGFVDFARKHFISALHGTGVGNLFASIQRAHACASVDLATPTLTRILEQAVADFQPPLARGRRIKLRYAHQGGRNPPTVIIHGNQTDAVPTSYKRYLANVYRQALRLEGTPLRLEFRTGENPFKEWRNTLTPRQVTKRKRLMRFAKRSK